MTTVLHQNLGYDPMSGRLAWLVKPSAKVAIGDIAGKVRKTDGYRIIRFRGRYFYAHRLANLREADPSESSANQKLRSDNRAGLKGVTFHSGHGLWQARVRFRGHRKTIGYYKTAEEAHAAYVAASQELQGKFARPA